jgi:hypothetical protein
VITIAEELFKVADATAEALAYARADDLQKPLAGIRTACDEAKRAWSGSNLGYHANVYWEDFSQSLLRFSLALSGG